MGTGDKLVCMEVQTTKQFENTLVATAEAETLAVTWSDCGDASTHAKVTDLQPTSIQTGGTTTLTGTGALDEDVNGATFSAVVTAGGVKVASCSGDASQDVVCKLPLGVGSITLKAQSFPLAAGSASIPVDVQVSSLVPASLAKTNSHIEAVSDTGDKLICMEVQTTKQFESTLVATAEAETLAVTWSDCGDASTHAKVTDLQPTSIQTGGTTTLTGTGALDEDVNGATFSAVVTAGGVKVASCSGDASQDVVCKLPLGVGSITLKAQSFP